MELEGVLGTDAPVGGVAGGGLEEIDAPIERVQEALLLVADDLGDLPGFLRELPEGAAERLDHRGHEVPEQRDLDPQRLVAVADSAAEDAPQHVPATLARRVDTVG